MLAFIFEIAGELLLQIVLSVPHVFLRCPGNLILYYVLKRDVHLNEDSFLAYAIGIAFWLVLAGTVWWFVIPVWNLFVLGNGGHH